MNSITASTTTLFNRKPDEILAKLTGEPADILMIPKDIWMAHNAPFTTQPMMSKKLLNPFHLLTVVYHTIASMSISGTRATTIPCTQVLTFPQK